MIGKTISHYRILKKLGAGGMGIVYRAHDERLGRDVALKLLPPEMFADERARARLMLEARLSSALNHPHICTLYEVGHHEGMDFLVMEYLEGETLAERLKSGPVPAGLAIRYAIEMAEALEEAHQRKILHRDLKPGNVMLTKMGTKILDFGLAKIAADAPSVSSLTAASTLAAPHTAEGAIVGTLQYVAPERLEGRPADARSDIWSLGATIYEMTTGRRAFDGETQALLIVAIMEKEPTPLTQLQPRTPAVLERVVKECLAKDPNERTQTAHDVKLRLQWIVEGDSQAGVPAPGTARRRSRERLAWGAAVLAAGTALIALLAPRIGHPPAGNQAVWFSVSAPAGTQLGNASTTQISPDGRNLAFIARDSSGSTIWLRPLGSPVAARLSGTEGAVSSIFWSPDSRHLGFFAGGKLKKISITGGSPEILCDAPEGRGGAWSPAGVILFASFTQGPLFRVPATGGRPVQVTHLDSERLQVAHRWPCFLPDGEHFLYTALPPREGQFDCFVGSLGSGEGTLLLNANSAPVFAPPGHILFTRDQSLQAQAFDPGVRRLRGGPVAVGELEWVPGNIAEPSASASSSGVLAFQAPRASSTINLSWIDRAGKNQQILGVPVGGNYTQLALSPDGTRAAIVSGQFNGSETDIWLLDLRHFSLSRLTYDSGAERYPLWSPDGDRVLYASDRAGPYDFYVKRWSGVGGEELVYKSNNLEKFPTDWSRDGRFLVFEQADPKTRRDIWVLPMSGNREPFPFVRTPFNETGGKISPDGKWIAYESNESGKYEIYVQAFPGPGERYQVSTGGGLEPRWSRNGGELLYRAPDGTMMAVEVHAGAKFLASEPRALFKYPAPGVGLVPTADGERFLVVAPAGEEPRSSINVVLNWTAVLERP